MINTIITGESLEILREMESNSIDCCITSPPYWGLRDYGNDKQLGNETHFKEFINNLCNIFDEVKRVLKDDGTCFINLGDTYGGSGTTKDKSLCMIPERFAIEMIDRGWTLRNQIIWHKPNQMPSSAKDRFTVDFEKVFFFVKQRSYYFDQQLESYTKPLDRWGGEGLKANGNSTWDVGTGQVTYRKRSMRPNPQGRNMRTVWSINTSPTREAHFATYPQELVNRLIKAGCPEGGIILDPFIGSGTTAICARKLNRNFVGIELNPDYVELANKRIFKEMGLFN